MGLRLLFLFFDVVWAASAGADSPEPLPEMGGCLMGGLSGYCLFVCLLFPVKRW